MDKYLFCIIDNELFICSRMVSWRTWDPIRDLKVTRLISSYMILIWQTGLGCYMMRAKRRAYADAGPIK